MGFHIQRIATISCETVDRIAGIAHRLGSFCREPPGPSHRGAAVSHQRGLSTRRRRTCSRSRRTSNGRLCCRIWALNATFMGVGVDRLDYTKGHPGALPRHRTLSGEVSAATRARLPLSRLELPAAPTSSATTTSWTKWRRRPTASTAASRREGGSRSFCSTGTQSSGNPALLSRGRSLPGHVAARRHESGGEGICRCARMTSTAF